LTVGERSVEPDHDGVTAVVTPSGPSSQWTRRRVRSLMSIVGAVQFVVVARIVSTSGFQQDDYLFFSSGHTNGLTGAGLTQSVFGSFIPGFNFVNTLLARSLPIARWPVVFMTMAMYAALIVVFYRLLELLFGARPAIVLLTSVGTCSGLLGVSLVWWTPAINGLPALILDLLALDGLIRHALTGRVRPLVISVVSFGVGALFYDPSIEVLVPLVLVVLLYLCDTWDLASIWQAFRSRTWAWVGYLVPVVASLGWRFLHPKKYQEPPVGSLHQITGFMVGGLTKGLTSSALGVNYLTLTPGAWTWGIIVLGQVLLVGVVAVTIMRRRQAWRAWALFFLSFIAADLVAAIGRASEAFYFQYNSLYWCYFLFLFVACFGLAVLPSPLTAGLATVEDANVHPKTVGLPTKGAALVATGVLCALGIHYIWTTPDHTLGARNRVFTQHMTSDWTKVSHAHPDAFVWDTAVPDFVLAPVFSPYNKMASTMGLVIGGLQIDTGSGPGYVVTVDGSLVPAKVRRLATQIASSVAPGVLTPVACINSAMPARIGVELDRPVSRGRWFVRIRYSRSAGEIIMVNGVAEVYVPKGSGTVVAHLPVVHPGRTLAIATLQRSRLCESVDVETPVPVAGG